MGEFNWIIDSETGYGDYNFEKNINKKTKKKVVENTNKNEKLYNRLRMVFDGSFDQAANGKGNERHATVGEKFEDQQICEITKRLSKSSVAGSLFQAVKKIYESSRLPKDRAIAELRGAINYIAAAIIVIEDSEEK